jgi:hypothetical protein
VKFDVGVAIPHPLIEEAAARLLSADGKNSAAYNKAVKRSEEEAFHDLLFVRVVRRDFRFSKWLHLVMKFFTSCALINQMSGKPLV